MKRTLAVAVLLAIVSPVAAPHAQQPPSSVPDRAKVIAAAREIMDKARYCTMITLGEDGQPQARIVDPFQAEEDLTIWIGTNPLTRKVAQIKKDPRVTLLYYDTARMSFVTLLAKGEVVTSQAEKGKHWKEAWAGMYKDKNRGDDYALVRVRPFRLEIVGPGFPNDPRTWGPVSIEVGTRPPADRGGRAPREKRTPTRPKV